jgi:hypothetical protein
MNDSPTIDGATVEGPTRRTTLRRRLTRLRATPFLGVLVLLANLAAYASDNGTIKFSLDFPGSDPEHYTLSVQSDGSAAYDCTAKISKDSDDTENYQTTFKFSDSNRARIFNLAAQAHYFSGNLDSGKKLAFTGTKKLTYKDGQHDSEQAYNFSSLAAVQQLTVLFQSVAATLEFGRRLEHYHHYQKLALDDELKNMEDQAKRGDLGEIQAVKPILQAIYDDASVINVVRARAQHIIEIGNAAPVK